MSAMHGLPPYAETLGIVEQPGGGAPLLVIDYAESLRGRDGFVHGGALGGLLEMAAIRALQHALGDQAARIKPINVTVDYMRGARAQPTFAQGRVSRLGNRIANVEAYAWQDDRARPVAAARMHVMIVRSAQT